MDKRRWCEAHPFLAQANLTRSWCNGVALCRTSSLQQLLRASRSSDTQRSSGGTLGAQRRQQVDASDSSGALRVLKTFFFQTARSAVIDCQLRSRAPPGSFSIRTAPSTLTPRAQKRSGALLPDSFAPWCGTPLSFFTGTRC